MKNLKDYNVQELNTLEIKEITGGNPWFFIGLFIATMNDISNNPEEFQGGLTNGWH